jgi:cytochrome c553
MKPFRSGLRAAAFAIAVAAGASPCSAATQGRQLAALCAACHLGDTRDAAIPPIAGLTADRIGEAMRAYRTGERSSQIMHAVAAALSANETAAVAQYLGAARRAGE